MSLSFMNITLITLSISVLNLPFQVLITKPLPFHNITFFKVIFSITTFNSSFNSSLIVVSIGKDNKTIIIIYSIFNPFSFEDLSMVVSNNSKTIFLIIVKFTTENITTSIIILSISFPKVFFELSFINFINLCIILSTFSFS